MSRILLALSMALSGSTAACAQPASQPACNQRWVELTGRVVDEADLLASQDEAALTAELAALESRNGRQFVVATVTSLQGKPIKTYSLCLANHWEVGRKGVNDGIILLVAPKERRVRIEVGMGLEAAVTDDEAKAVIDGAIVPAFRAGDFPRGISAGAKALIGELQ